MGDSRSRAMEGRPFHHLSFARALLGVFFLESFPKVVDAASEASDLVQRPHREQAQEDEDQGVGDPDVSAKVRLLIGKENAEC